MKTHELSNLGENALNDHNFYFPFSHQPIIDPHLFPFKPNRLLRARDKALFFLLFIIALFKRWLKCPIYKGCECFFRRKCAELRSYCAGS